MRKWLRRSFGTGCLLAALLLIGALFGTTPVFAATTADVAVNATPAYVSISNAPIDYGFGTVAVSTNYSTSQGYFTVTDSSTVNIDVAVSCNTTWAGGVTWTHDDTGTPGVDTAALYCSPNTNAFDIVVKNTSPNDLVSNNSGNIDWELRLMAPTVFGDGVLKTNTVTLTATAS